MDGGETPEPDPGETMNEGAAGGSDAGRITTAPGNGARRGYRRAASVLAAATRAGHLVLLTALIHSGLAAQDPERTARPPATLTGVVRDSGSLEPIAFARVAVSTTGGETDSASGSSDRFGAFVIPTAPVGQVHIEATAFGYARWTRDYDELPSGLLEILLVPAPILLDSAGGRSRGPPGRPDLGLRDAFVVDPAMIRAMPTVLETDVLRVLTMSPSASAPSDFVSMPHIRGGTSDGTPVMLDGVRLFNPFHVGGFLSAVSADAVDHAALLPGSGAGAQHIGSLSGAIEIATRDGVRDRHRVAGAVSLASSRLTVEGPLGGSTSYLIDGRRTYIDLLSQALAWVRVIDEPFPYSFSDVLAKVTRDFGGFRRLSVTGYLNSEGIEYENKADVGRGEEVTSRDDYDWGNAAVLAHYRDRLGGGAFLDLTVGHSSFGNDQMRVQNLHQPMADTSVSGGGHMKEDRADLRATWHLPRGTLTAGAQALRFTGHHDYRLTRLEDILPLLHLSDQQWRIGLFANVHAPLGRTWNTRAGVRLDRFAGVASTLAPFAELNYAGAWWEARISAGLSYQALSSLRNEESVRASFIAYDLVAPVDSGPVPRSSAVSAGWEGSRGAWRLRLDAYANKLDYLRLPVPPKDPLEELVLGDPSLRLVGSGTATGVEATWSWAGGPLSTVGSYRWSRVRRTVDSMTYVPRFHRDHELEFGAALESGRSLWSARFSLRSGQPTTPILGIMPIGHHNSAGNTETRWVLLEGDFNAGRLPHYLRLDLGWRRRQQGPSAGGRVVMPFISLTNLFSAPNVLAADVKVDVDEGGRGIGVDSHYLPQMPMLAFFGVEFRF